RIRIHHDAGARLHVRLAAGHDDGPDRDAEIEIAGEVEIADGPGVDASARWFQLLDDLHRAHLWRAGDGARGKTGDERIEPIAILGELAFDDRRQVHHVREALEAHELRHADRSVLTHATDVVATEVDEHHVLG